MSRCLDVPGQRLVLREPFVIRQIWEAARLYPGEFTAGKQRKLLRLVLPYFAQPALPGERVLLKPTNLAVDLMPMLAKESVGTSVLLFDSLENFLVSVLKKSAETHTRVIDLAQGWIESGSLHGVGRPNSSALLANAACFWFHHVQQLVGFAQRFPGRSVSLDFPSFLARPATVLQALLDRFGEKADQYTLTPLQRNAKTDGDAYGPDQRESESAWVRRKFHGRIQRALDWADASGIDIDITERLRPSEPSCGNVCNPS